MKSWRNCREPYRNETARLVCLVRSKRSKLHKHQIFTFPHFSHISRTRTTRQYPTIYTNRTSLSPLPPTYTYTHQPDTGNRANRANAYHLPRSHPASTTTMGQLWEMIAHKRYETLGCWGKAGEVLSQRWPAEIIHRLAIPVRDSHNTSPTHPSPQEQSRLVSLPVDLILLIVDQLAFYDSKALSNTCWVLHNHLCKVVGARFRQTSARWANTPLIYAGEYMRSNPPGITTRVPKGFQLVPQLLHTLEPPGYNDLTVFDVLRHSDPTNVQHCFPPRNILGVRKIFPPWRRWVLRNLTTKEYVYAHVFTSRNGRGGGYDSPDTRSPLKFDIGTLIFVNTCWSDDESAAMTGLNVRGRWAGHCFDIVEEVKLLQDMEALGGGWVDVSFREYTAMVKLWNENGWPDWL